MTASALDPLSVNLFANKKKGKKKMLISWLGVIKFTRNSTVSR